MNEFLPADKYDEQVTRLALGIEPIDKLRGGRVPHPIQITCDQVPLGLPRPRIWRHNSCAFVLLFGEGVGVSIDLRFFDCPKKRRMQARHLYPAPSQYGRTASPLPIWDPDEDRRRYVPRRIRIPLLSLDKAEEQPHTQRIRRPALFPGAAYDVSESSTGMRGRVERNKKSVRWARIEAIQPGSGQIVGRAHCDDRGEFLLLLEPQAAAPGDLAINFSLDLRIYAPITPGLEVTDAMKKLDPLWDLPIEEAPAPDVAEDKVCAGDPPWAKWVPAGTQSATFRLGRLSRQCPALEI
jgi:hypothetical protein